MQVSYVCLLTFTEHKPYVLSASEQQCQRQNFNTSLCAMYSLAPYRVSVSYGILHLKLPCPEHL
jgi:hypothetical protein